MRSATVIPWLPVGIIACTLVLFPKFFEPGRLVATSAAKENMNAKKVLILCTGNSCRSQMAEALWRQLGQGDWIAFSAGSRPAGYVHPLAIEAMRELNIDISKNDSKPLGQFLGDSFDLVVTVCDNARESCPAFPGAKQVLHWPFEDPADAEGTKEEKMRVFRTVRDQIRRRIADFLTSGATSPTAEGL